MKKLKIMIAAILAASLTMSATGCKPTVATQKETLGSTTSSFPVAVAEDKPTTNAETTTVTEATTTAETTTEATTTETIPVLAGQGSDVLADLKRFIPSEFTDTSIKISASQGNVASVHIDTVKKTDGDISYELVNDMSIKMNNTQDSANASFLNSMDFSMKDIETYTSGDTQYMSEKGLCSMMESMTQMLIQLLAGMGASFTSEDGSESTANSVDVQEKLNEAIDMLHKAIQDFIGNSQNRYIKVTKEDLLTAMSGMSIDTSNMMPKLDFDPSAFAEAFEPVKADFCSSDGEYNIFRVTGENKDLFFDTILKLDDDALSNVMNIVTLGNSSLNTSMSLGTMTDGASGTQGSVREQVLQMKETATDDYCYEIRTTTAPDGYMTLVIDTNCIINQTTDADNVIPTDASINISITGGTLTDSISLPSEDNVISFAEWYESFNEATASAMQALNGSSAE